MRFAVLFAVSKSLASLVICCRLFIEINMSAPLPHRCAFRVQFFLLEQQQKSWLVFCLGDFLAISAVDVFLEAG